MHCKAALDGKDLTDDYLVLEAMNIRSIGPNLELAPGADPGDGLLDVVAVSRTQGDALREHLARGKKRRQRPPDLPTYRGRELNIEWTDFDVHFDDDIWPERRPVSSESKSIDIKLEDQGVEFLTPPQSAASS